MNTPKLETNRLILRKFNENDLKSILWHLSDKEVNLYLPWFPVKNLKEAKDFYQERNASIYQKEQRYAYAICLKENNLPIDYVNIDLDDSHDLGYGLKEYWHQGIVSEAVEAVIQQAKRIIFVIWLQPMILKIFIVEMSWKRLVCIIVILIRNNGCLKTDLLFLEYIK